MTSRNSEIDELDTWIAEEDITEKQLVEQLIECRQRKRSLVERRAILRGEDYRDYTQKSIPDLLEILFRKYGRQHIKEAARLMESEFGRVVATQTISGALIRYVQRGKRFKKVGNNTFDIADEEYQK